MVKNQITKHARWMMFLVGPNSQPSDAALPKMVSQIPG
jgi:hypothetical protein